MNISDEFLGTVAPLIVYWIYSGFYVLFGSMDKYRLHTKQDEDEKNLVSKSTVVKGVLLQQLVQAIVAIILFTMFVLIKVNNNFGRLTMPVEVKVLDMNYGSGSRNKCLSVGSSVKCHIRSSVYVRFMKFGC
ncbi:hypothetical protein CTI12_AA523110 [Artemisia annua]|uniref:Uncharacterized protein n=1 Tax=Artemisia annua TaxID=35608 RepID=A0A2U1L6Y2_ARTAN|nr:hypothetical protein CTI12_AA523110 [Artemisia annua]